MLVLQGSTVAALLLVTEADMSSLIVTAVGMVTSLGDSRDGCAAARAGLVRIGEITSINAAIDPDLAREGLDGAPPFVGHSIDIIGAGSAGVAKLLALSQAALDELLAQPAFADSGDSRLGLSVSLSDAFFQHSFGEPPEPLDENPEPDYADYWAGIVREFPGRLRDQHSLSLAPEACHAVAGGRTGFFDALWKGAAMIRAGQIDRCIVGAVESCLEPDALRAYAAAGVVKCATNPAGFLPGEAAAFVLLERGDQPGDGFALRIAGTGRAMDTSFHAEDAVPCGVGLSEAISAALKQARAMDPEPVLVIADLNGTPARASDWGHTLVRLRSTFGERQFDLWLPALSFGETGAACGALALCMAFRAGERRYLPGAHVVIALSSEDGRRAAFVSEGVRH